VRRPAGVASFEAMRDDRTNRANRHPAPWVALAITLLLTAIATTLYGVAIEARDRVRFEAEYGAAERTIRARMEQYSAALRGGVGLFAASDHVSRGEFRAYVEQVDVQHHYPGVQGMGFAQRVSAESLDSLEAAMRPEIPTFAVHPIEPRDVRFPIVYLEPMDERNRAALGYDMYTHHVRREAMDRAWRTGEAALSGSVVLRQELDLPDPQPGFLIYQPVHRGGGVPRLAEEREQALIGFVYAPFRAWDLFDELRRNLPPLLAFRVYDGRRISEAALLYDSHPDASARAPRPRRSPADSIMVAGHTWTLEFESVPGFEAGQGHWLEPLIAVVGILVSLVLFWMTRSQVMARAEAERIEATRGRFFAAMSHELRTPVNAIMGYNDLLLGGIYGPLPAQQVQGIERSQKAARHLAELVNDVLDLSKIEAGKVRLDLEAVDVSQVIDDLLSTIRPLAESRGSSLDLHHTDCARTITTDPRRLRQILLNLISNASKFGEGKPITVRCRTHGDGVAIQVIDRGSGISARDVERIFDEFVQLERGNMDGTGLGLAISKRLAAVLSGSLEVESAVGVGSTFTLTLPSRPAR